MADRAESTVVGANQEKSHSISAQPERVLALEVRPQKIGFVVFDGATKLADHGVCWTINARTRSTIAQKAIRRLLNRYQPAIIVVRPSEKASMTADAVSVALTIIRNEARQRSARCHTVHALEVRRFYGRLGCTTKDEIALLMAEWFAVFAPIVPSKRKAWHREHHRTCVFDAAAVGVFFFGTSAPTEA